MERNIPKNFDKLILFPLIGHEKKDHTESNYLVKINEFERKVESSLIDTFGRISIDASVKTDPFSLPYQKEILITLYGESYMNGPYEIYRVARKIVKQLLDDHVWKIRFYVLIEIDPDARLMGKINYYFRYYEHGTL